MSDRLKQIESLSKLYTELTGSTVRLGYLQKWQAREWLEMGFTEADLKLVVRYINKKVEASHIRISMLRWSFLIGHPDRFDEELQEAKMFFKHAKKAPSDKERVESVTGRTSEEQVKDTARTPAQVMSEAGLKAFEDFKAFGRSLNS